MISFSSQASYAGWERRWDTRGLKLECQIYATGGRQVPKAKGAFKSIPTHFILICTGA